MFLTDYVIIAFIALFLLYALYDEFIMDRLKGKTRLKVNLQRRSRLDSLIFIGLIGIVIYNNLSSHGPQITTTLLLVLAFISIYIFWIRQPKILFKAGGFFYSNVWIDSARIQSMNLSEDGVLVIQLERRRLLVHVKKIDDLEKIYQVMIENQ